MRKKAEISGFSEEEVPRQKKALNFVRALRCQERDLNS